MDAPTKDRWTRAMEGASWVDLVVGVAILLGGMAYAPGRGALWSAAIVGSLVTLLSVYEEWAESHGRQDHVRLTAAVNILAGLWLIGFALVTTVSPGYFWLTATGGLILVVLEAFNIQVAHRLSQADQAPWSSLNET